MKSTTTMILFVLIVFLLTNALTTGMELADGLANEITSYKVSID